MIGIYTKQQNIETLERLEARVKELEGKRRSSSERAELAEAKMQAAEINQWLADLHRIEG